MTSHKSQSAFSLIEVVMAIGIVAFAFISVLGLIPTGLNTFRLSIDASVGAQIVQRVMNEAQQTDFDVLTQNIDGASFRYFDDQGNEIETAASSGAIYQVQTRVNPVTTIPGNSNYSTVATIIIQIANNPAHQPISQDRTTHLWNDNRLSIATYSGFVSRNK